MFVLFLGALSFVTSSFAPVSGIAVVQSVNGSITTCPACGYEMTNYNVDSGIFYCPHCKCKWKKLDNKNVVIVSPPEDQNPN